MPDKKKVLLDSIAKLRRLNVSEDEIVSYLKEFGISENYIRSLLAGDTDAPVELENPQETLEETRAQIEEAFAPPVINDLPVTSKKKPDSKKPVVQTVSIEAPPSKSQKTKSVSSFEDETASGSQKTALTLPDQTVSSLWEKGILNTVTDSLLEIKKIRDDLDKTLESRIQKALDKESVKMAALQDNTQKLMISKMNSELEKKSGEIVETLDQRIAELKKNRDELRQEQESIKTERKVASELFKQLSKELAHSKELRDKSLVQLNADTVKYKSELVLTLEDARKKMLAIEDRATKTLELEHAIINSWVKDANNRIDRLTIEKINELSSDANQKLEEVDRISREIDAASLRREFEDIKNRLNDLEMGRKR